MDEKEIQKLTKKALAELGIDRPVLSTRLKGNTLELFLYGGDQITYPLEEKKAPSKRKKNAK